MGKLKFSRTFTLVDTATDDKGMLEGATFGNLRIFLVGVLILGFIGCSGEKRLVSIKDPCDALVLRIRLLPSDKPNIVHWAEELQNTSDKILYVQEGSTDRDIGLIAEWRTVEGRRRLVYDAEPDFAWDSSYIDEFPRATGCATEGGPMPLKPSEIISSEYSITILHAGLYQLETKWFLGCGESNNSITECEVHSPLFIIKVTPNETIGYIGWREAFEIAEKVLRNKYATFEDFEKTMSISPDSKKAMWILSYDLRQDDVVKKKITLLIDRKTGKVVIKEE